RGQVEFLITDLRGQLQAPLACLVVSGPRSTDLGQLPVCETERHHLGLIAHRSTAPTYRLEPIGQGAVVAPLVGRSEPPLEVGRGRLPELNLSDGVGRVTRTAHRCGVAALATPRSHRAPEGDGDQRRTERYPGGPGGGHHHPPSGDSIENHL